VLRSTELMFLQSPFPPPPLAPDLAPADPVANFVALVVLFGFLMEMILHFLPEPWGSEAWKLIFEAATFGRYRK
jgi:hypothetical protein